MSKIKEILATTVNKITHNARDNQIEELKEQFMERIITTASEGEFNLYMNINSAKGRWGELKSWLENLGFVVSWSIPDIVAIIKWDDISIAKSVSDGNSLYCSNCGAKMIVRE